MAADNSSITNFNADSVSATATEPASPFSADALMPVGKLDADNYNAEDLDGVTQGLFGSGNLNYLTLQGRETDAMLATNAGEISLNDMEHTSTENAAMAIGARAMADTRDVGVEPGLHGLFHAPDSGAHEVETISAMPAVSHLASIAPLTGGAVAASATQAFSILSSNSVGDLTTGGHNGQDGASGASGVNGIDGSGGANGTDGGDGGGSITNIVNNIVDDSTTLVDHTVHNVINLVDNTVGDVTSIVNNTVGDVTSIVNNLLPGGGGDGDIDLFVHNDVGLPQVDLNLDPIESIVGDINVGVGLTHSQTGATVDIGALVANIPLVDASLPVNVPLVGQVLDAVPDTNDLLQNPIGTLENTVTGLTDAVTTATGLPDVQDILQDPLGAVTDTVNTVVGDVTTLLSPPSGNDTDLSVHNDLGLPQVDVNLDPVESIVGDVDVGVDVTHTANSIGLGTDAVALGDTLLDNSTALGVPDVVDDVATPLVDTVTEALSDPATIVQDPVGTVTDIVSGLGGDILPPADNSASDTDLTVHNDLGLPQVDVNLDPVESITGDIDIGVDATHTDSTLGLGADALALGSQIVDTGTTVMDGGLVGTTVDNLTAPLTGGADDLGNLTSLGGDSLTDTASGILGQSADMTSTTDTALDVLGTATDALGDITGSGTETAGLGDITGGLDGGLGDVGAWPQTDDASGVSSAVADTLGSLLSGGDDTGSALSGPEGSIGEGLGLLGTGADHDSGGGLLSGLGDAHHGGLFG